MATQASSIAAESLDYSEGRVRFQVRWKFCFLTPWFDIVAVTPLFSIAIVDRV